MQNIDCQGFNFVPACQNEPFIQTFYGNNNTISNLKITCDSDYCGIFAKGSGASFMDLNLFNVNVSSQHDYVGAFLGAGAKDINNSIVKGEIKGNNSVGGFVGTNSTHISNSFVSLEIKANSSVGGFVGGYSGDIYDSFVKGNINGTSDVGGFVGLNSTHIENSFNIANISYVSQ
jgi:hypothetical protein